jgi:hypothetical protein
MTYERPEALELGAAANVILGSKEDDGSDIEFQRPVLLVVEELV